MTCSTDTRTFKRHKKCLNVTHENQPKNVDKLQTASADLFLVWYTIDPCVVAECYPSPFPPKNRKKTMSGDDWTHSSLKLQQSSAYFLKFKMLLLFTSGVATHTYPASCLLFYYASINSMNAEGFWLYSLITSSYKKKKKSHKLKTKPRLCSLAA